MHGDPVYAALDPRGEAPAVRRVALAQRLDAIDGARVAIVLTMPPGSGLEDVETRVRERLEDAGAAATTMRRRDFMVDDPQERAQLVADADAAVLIVGPTGTSAFVTTAYGGHLEEAGLPAVLVAPRPVAPVARHAAGRSGVPVRILQDADDVVQALTRPRSDDERRCGVQPPATRPAVACTGSLAEVQAHFEAQGWTDGLPIVPPTAEAVEAMLAGTSRAPEDLVTPTLRPEGLPARVRDVAVAAVMAGAAAPQLPVVLAAAEVMGDVEFESMTRSVNSFAFTYVVNGPIALAAGMTGGLGALGPGHRGNAAVGRALGLLTRTVGGARLGVTATPTQGNPAAWAFAFAENERDSPWAPLHTSCGFAAEESAVSVFSGGWSHWGNFYYGQVQDLVDAVSAIDSLTGVLLLVSAKRAAQLHAQGFTRESLEEHLWRAATRPLRELRAGPFFPLMRSMAQREARRGPAAFPAEYLTDPDDRIVPRFPHGGVRVAVAGGDVSNSMQLWALTHHATVSVDAWR
jgi:hypothetical protein